MEQHGGVYRQLDMGIEAELQAQALGIEAEFQAQSFSSFSS